MQMGYCKSMCGFQRAYIYTYHIQQVYIYMCMYVPTKSKYSHRSLLKTLHRLANSHLHSKRDTYIYKESLLLYRSLFKSLCVFFNRHVCTHIILTRYIYTCTYMPAKSRYSHRLLLKNTHRLVNSHLHSKRVTYIYK